MCWSTYSVASQAILKRHSPLLVIGLTFSIGATLYVLTMTPILIGDGLARDLGIQLAADADLGAAGAEPVVLDLVYRPEEARRLAHLGLQLPDAGRRDDRRGDLAGEPISANQIAGAGAIFAGLLITRFVN